MKEPSSITLFELQIFSEMAGSRSLRDLARRLKLQPAHLSKVLKRLERKLGTELLTRSPQGVRPTPAAQQLLGTVDEILEMVRRLSSDDDIDKDFSPIGIAAVSFLQQHLIVGILPQLKQLYPQQRFRLLEFSPDDIIRHGLAGAFHFAVHLGALDWPQAWSSQLVGKIKFGLFANAEHPLKTTAREKDLAFYRFIIPTYWSTDRFVYGTDHCPLPLRHRIRSHETMTAITGVRAVLHSHDLVFAPLIVALPFLQNGSLKEITVSDWPRVENNLFLSVRSGSVKQSIFKGFLKSLQDALASMPPTL